MTDEADSSETKLTRTKQKWAREGKFLTGRHTVPGAERLPPGQHLVRDWPVLDLGMQPTVTPRSWRLDVTGLVASKASWSFDEYKTLKQSSFLSDIHCVTTWSRYDNRWEGVSTHDLLDIVQPLDAAKAVTLHSYDGYTTNLLLDDFASPDALLAHSWEGQPLTQEHGGPVRLVVPHLYFWKSAKWISRIDFHANNKPGFWEVRGYHMRGDPWAEERYSDE